MVGQLVIDSPTSDTLKFITVFVAACHVILFWAS